MRGDGPKSSVCLVRLVSAAPYRIVSNRFSSAGGKLAVPVFLPQSVPEAIARAVQQHAQIISVHLQLPADQIFVLFVEQHAADQPAVFFRHVVENSRHQFPPLRREQLPFRARAGIDNIRQTSLRQ